MEKLNKRFECGNTLQADELNSMVAKSNEIIKYIEDHEDNWLQQNGGGSGGDTLNYPLNSINSAGLQSPGESDMAIVSNGSGWAWKKIGSSSSSGTGKDGSFKSRVFCRTNTNIGSSAYTPTGGTYNNPWPGGTNPSPKQNGIIWHDGVPSGSEPIWSSVCTFKGDGTNTGWSIPSRETDTIDLDIEFSLSQESPAVPTGDPFSDKSRQGWYDPEKHKNTVDWTAMVWRAERKVKNGAYEGNWVISRIKGEKGDQGEGAGTGSYVISSNNDNAIIDYRTVGESALREATLNVLTVYKGGTNVTSECTYSIQNTVLPTGLDAKSVDNSTNKNSFVIYPTSSPSTLTPSDSSHQYYYDVTISHNNTLIGTKRFKLYVASSDAGSSSAYDLVIDPPYVIFEEEIGEGVTNEETGVTTYPPGNIVYYESNNNNGSSVIKRAYTNWRAKVRLLKDGVAQEIACTNLNNTLVTARVDYDYKNNSIDYTTLIVTIDEIPSGITNREIQTEGKISFWIKVNNNPLFQVIIPVYINRIGSRVQTIIGDTETTIMSKTIYDASGNEITDNGNVIKYGNIGTYIRSSQTNIQRIEQSINGIPSDASEIFQTAKQISLSVNSGYKNYIVSPLAMTAAKDSNCYLYGSSDMGDVVKITNPNGSNNTGNSLTFKIDDSYRNLDTNAKVTVYALVRCLSTGDLHFGWNDGSEAGRFMLSLSAIAEKAPTVSNNPNKGTTNKIDTIQFGYTTWYLCYRTFTPSEILGSSSKRDYTVNTITGSWLVHSVGIIRSEIIPTIDSIIHDNGYKSAGIDITAGKIDLIAGKTQFKSTADNDVTKIVVSPGNNTGEGPRLVGKQNNNDTFILESYNNGDAGGVLTVQNNNDYTVKVRPQVIVMNSPNCNVHIDTHTGYLLIRTGDGKGIQLQPGSGAVNSNNPSRIIISNLRRHASDADSTPSIGELYYDGDGVVHYWRGNSLAPELDEDLTGDPDTTGTEGSDAPALDLNLTGEVDESTGENTPTNEETTTDGGE